MRKSHDEGYIQVLEAILVTLVMLGAAYAVVTLKDPSVQSSRPRQGLHDVATDALSVLAGLANERGVLLDDLLAESYHCVEDPTPSTTTCQGTAGANLTMQLSNALPKGAGYAVLVDNGVATRELYRSPLPGTEITSTSKAIDPSWNLTFAIPELSCYDTGMNANVTLLPIDHELLGNASAATVNMSSGGPWTATRGNNSTLLGAWNVTLPSASRPGSGNVTVNLTGKRGTYPGITSYSWCYLANQGGTIANALRNQTSFTANPTAPVGGTMTFSANLTTLAGTTNVSIVSANVTVYEPLPPSPGIADGYAPLAVVALPSGNTPSATWSVPANDLYGLHPVVLRVLLHVTLPNGTANLEARKVAETSFALPSGTVPIEVPYRVVVQAWFPDWR